MRCCVLTPVYRPTIDDDEFASLSSISRYLSAHDHFAVAPDSLELGKLGLSPQTKIRRFADSFFESTQSYNRLLLSSMFYRTFAEYDFLLIVQLDALALSNDLDHWCTEGWDYIGAPWAKNFHTRPGLLFEGVGNGGFSLRNVQSALRVLATKIQLIPDYTMGPPPRWWHWKRVRKMHSVLNIWKRFMPAVAVEDYLRRYYTGNEDIFWGKYAARFDPTFRVPPAHEALSFAFETDPEGSFDKNGGRLPFGVHAWAKYGRKFWESCGVVPSQSNRVLASGEKKKSPATTFTIVTPSFNQVGFVPDMVASIKKQNWLALEHIVVDAGSTDGSVKVWRNWERNQTIENVKRKPEVGTSAGETEKDNVSVIVLVEADHGQSDAINKGMRIATGEIVSWLNADDVLLPGALLAVNQAFHDHAEAVVVIGTGARMDLHGKLLRMVPGISSPQRRQWAFETVQPAMFFKRDAYWEVGGLDESLHYAMDWELLLKLSKLGKIVAIPDHLANIRYYPETKTNTGGWKRMHEIARIARRHNGILDRNYLSFQIRSLLAKQPFKLPKSLFDHLCWNLFRDPPLMVQGWPERVQKVKESDNMGNMKSLS